jgi:hypothetical protein
MQGSACPLWLTRAKLIEKNDSFWFVDSPRAGGTYKITTTALSLTANLETHDQVRITNWLIGQRSTGVSSPELNSETLKTAKSHRFFLVSEMVDRALVWLADNLGSLGKAVPLGTSIKNYHGTEYLAETTQALSAATGSVTTVEAMEILEFAVAEGWVTSNPQRAKYDGGFFSLTFRGHQRAESLRESRSQSSQAFVAMWFSSDLDHVYLEGFQKGILDAGYRPLRIDRKEHNNKIDDEIVSEIRRSRFLVADFTSEIVERKTKGGKQFKDTHARGGVYFEAGFAKGLGKEVIWTVREDVLPFVHFDTRQFAHIVWKDAADLRQQLSRRISATLGDGPEKKPT